MTSDSDPIFLKNCWYVAAWDSELIDGAKLARTLLERPIVIYRGESGKVVTLDDRCCHRGAPLSMGRIEGDCIRCMYHGMKFEPSGRCMQIPGQEQDRNCQFMTPETRRTTHFFWNYLHNFDLDDPNIALSLCNSLREGFMEDKAIIEAQQKLFDREPDTTLLAIAADAPLAHFRRVFGQRLAAENQAIAAAA
jgi:phenylpropionate dioxygenase-like ring-hydroxylating dioxygenase large terminal subunit